MAKADEIKVSLDIDVEELSVSVEVQVDAEGRTVTVVKEVTLNVAALGRRVSRRQRRELRDRARPASGRSPGAR